MRQVLVGLLVSLFGLSASSAVAGALVGHTTGGTIGNVSPACVEPVICSLSEDGTAITFGSGNSSVSTTTAAFNTDPGQLFVIGTLSWSNRQDLAGSLIDHFTVTFNSGDVSSGALFDNLSLTFTLQFNSTPNSTGDPLLDADYLQITSGILGAAIGNPNFGDQFRLQEDASSTVELVGRFGSFQLVGFGAVLEGPGFVTWSVPEPSSLILLCSGLIAAALSSRRRRSTC